MKLVSLIKTGWALFLFAVGQVFAWLNRHEERKAQHAADDRVHEIMSAAAQPNPENADRINRWLSRGRSRRLRRRP